jgi:hypothetical protein
VTEASDVDAIVVVRELQERYPSGHGSPVEVVEVTDLRKLPDWFRPAVLWNEPLLDKTGEVAEQLREITTVDPASAAEPLDGYINLLYRSLKNARVGEELGALLDAQEALPYWLQFVFNVHGRIRPYNKWLAWELREHPLPVVVDLELRHDPHAWFRWTEELARERGLGQVVDGWEPDVSWLRGSQSSMRFPSPS